MGIRLHRENYWIDVITLPTWEEAPIEFRTWLTQRTRWLKGWIQTILVHNRNPVLLAYELGFFNFIVFQLMLTAVVISALIHPIFAGYLIFSLYPFFNPVETGIDAILINNAVFNLVGGYTTYGFLACLVLRHHNRSSHTKFLFGLPLYWLLISFAGWRAVLQIFVDPHRWEKTPHGLVRNGNCHNCSIEPLPDRSKADQYDFTPYQNNCICNTHNN